MKKAFQIVFFCFIGLHAIGQIQPIGNWRTHASMQNIFSVDSINGKIIAASSNGYFTYDPSRNELITQTKATGLSDISIKVFSKQPGSNLIVIGYENGNIDIGSNNYNLATFTTNNYVVSNIGSNNYNQVNFVSNNYLQTIASPVSNGYATVTFTSNNYVQNFVVSNTFAQTFFTSNNYITNNIGSNNYNQATFVSNNYLQTLASPVSNSYATQTFISNNYLYLANLVFTAYGVTE